MFGFASPMQGRLGSIGQNAGGGGQLAAQQVSQGLAKLGQTNQTPATAPMAAPPPGPTTPGQTAPGLSMGGVNVNPANITPGSNAPMTLDGINMPGMAPNVAAAGSSAASGASNPGIADIISSVLGI